MHVVQNHCSSPEKDRCTRAIGVPHWQWISSPSSTWKLDGWPRSRSNGSSALDISCFLSLVLERLAVAAPALPFGLVHLRERHPAVSFGGFAVVHLVEPVTHPNVRRQALHCLTPSASYRWPRSVVFTGRDSWLHEHELNADERDCIPAEWGIWDP